jgi:DNA polymerase-3 subunit gamma/tau
MRDGSFALAVSNAAQRSKCEQYRGDVDKAMVKALGAAVPLTFVVDSAADRDDDPPTASAPAASSTSPKPAPATPTPDEEIDLTDLVDAPPEAAITPIDRLAQAFPGSELLDERR